MENMEEIALYRKYRPHNFDNLVGQDHIKTTLINALQTGRVSHAYLFAGPRGTGKTSTARLIAKALNCTNLEKEHEPCNTCEFCMDINEGRLIDVIEIDAASNRGIDEVRDLKEKINFSPTRAKIKVYIIDEVHMMTKEAFNALLKTLEEPPTHVYFILATTEIHKLPETIISRCQRFDFRRISHKALLTRLSYICQKENIAADDRALDAISKYVEGGLRDAIGLVEQLTRDGKLSFEQVREVLGVSDFSLLENLMGALMKKNTEEALRIIHELYGQGSDLKQFVHEFVDLLRMKMLASVAEGKAVQTGEFIRMIEIFQEAQRGLDSAIPQLPLEIAVIRISGPVQKGKAETPATIEEKAPEKVIKEAEPKKEEKRAHKKIEEKSGEFSLQMLIEQWPRVIERVTIPASRMSLKDSVPVGLDGAMVVLEFSTKFHKDKVMEHENRVELEKIIEEMYGVSLKISAQLKALEIKPVVDEEKDKSVDEVLEIFGGELVE
ncbi:DNA polymerase III subunit gamma/tau [Candidatus Peregrinibacteria bacterium]|nr:DNA polymerase III subunit gamma/tau [Candidatus Peregrinibacteria bacterium]